MFISNISHHCFYGNISDIINYYYTEILECELALISDSLDIKISNPSSNICIGFDINNLYIGANRLGYSLNKIEENNIYSTFKDYINNNIPILIGINTNYLFYNNVYRNTNRLHYIVIYGINETAGTLLISDSYIPTMPKTFYNGEYDLNIIKNNIENNNVDMYYIKKNVNEEPNIQMEKIFKKYIIKRTLNYDNYDISKFHEILKENEINILKETNLNYLAYVVRVGGVISRFDYLIELCKKYLINTFDIILKLNKIKNDWEIICNMFIKLSIIKTPKYFIKCLNKISEAIKQEQSIYLEIFEKCV